MQYNLLGDKKITESGNYSLNVSNVVDISCFMTACWLLLLYSLCCCQASAYRLSCINRVRGGAVWQLVGLITRRSQVRILPPLPTLKLIKAPFSGLFSLQAGNYGE